MPGEVFFLDIGTMRLVDAKEQIKAAKNAENYLFVRQTHRSRIACVNLRSSSMMSLRRIATVTQRRNARRLREESEDEMRIVIQKNKL